MFIDIKIQKEDFSVDEQIARLKTQSNDFGAVIAFVGLVREKGINGELLSYLEIEHYPEMSEKQIRLHIDEAARRWPLLAVCITHRVGQLKVGEQIVNVVVASEHRASAFEAAEFLMDYLKTHAPFWKKQVSVNKEIWIETGEENFARLNRWRYS